MQAIRTEPATASDVKILLDVDDLPRAWYNILPDLPAPFPPYLHPGTKEPVPPQAFEPLFPKELIRQEMSPNRAEPIPDELREAYFRLGRPTPLYRAKRLEAFLKTPARIYYKREDLSPVGSHKPNTAFAQAYFAAQEGVEALATETGAGQWGSALALATNYFGLKAKVFMVRVSYDQKPYRKYVMNLYGAEVIPSPSHQTNVGKKDTLGHTFVPQRIHAGGLRYHGTAATLSVLLDSGLVEPRAVDQVSTFQAGEIFAKTEGLIPARETCHAIRGAIDLALEAKERPEETVIAFHYSGHGLLDLEGYRQFMEGNLKNNGT